MENVSSEQELKDLLEDGKITEDEYRELLEAIRQKEKPAQSIQDMEKPNQPKPPHSGYGKAALILFILFMVLPLMSIFLVMMAQMSAGVMYRKIAILSAPLVLIGLLCGLLAFIFGIIGWKTASGKVAALGVPITGCFVPMFLILVGLFSYRFAAVKLPVPVATVVHRPEMVLHQSYPLDSLDGLLSQDIAVIDENIYVSGSGSLRLNIPEPASGQTKVIRLFETGPIRIENRMLFYSAKLRSENLSGTAYLEMWCDIPGKGEFFSRGLDQPIAGTTEWTTVQTPFRLELGQMPANVKLNLVVEGAGTVWIDDIELLSSPL